VSPATLQELQALERDYVIGTYIRNPVQFVRGQGCRLWDSDGHEYLDFLAGISVLNVGHCHPRVVAAVREQAGRLTHATNLYYTEAAMRLSAGLSRSSLGGKVFLCNSGAEANEAAIKLVRRARHEGNIVVLQDGFHGRTYGALSATPQESKQAPFAPLVPGFMVVPKDPEALAAAVDEHTAAVLLEPIQGETGINVLSDELLAAARAACDHSGAALVFDEIQTGMGRTGKLFHYEHAGIEPDIMTLGKGIGGGVPLAALLATEKACCFVHGDQGGTFCGNPLMCAAGLAVLDEVGKPSFLKAATEAGLLLESELQKLSTRHGLGNVRGRGLLLALDLKRPIGAAVVAQALEAGLLLNSPQPDALRFMPALNITRTEIAEMIDGLDAILTKAGTARMVA
jgi:acetylornithine/N-succinyldiaminopimelate aminotransferase